MRINHKSRYTIYVPQCGILSDVIDEVDEVLIELPGNKGVVVLVLLPYGRIAYGHQSPINSFFNSIYLWSMVFGSHIMQLHQCPSKIFLYLSVLLPFTSSLISSHFILGIQLVSLLQRFHLLWGLYHNILSLIQVHCND